ncbi:MAG: helix-turn-helix transcriptional regulator, partial [Acidobacteria bacterium]|nr:helix-turn-helix transcriptional regulator [Acidobacteriota bacterium]
MRKVRERKRLSLDAVEEMSSGYSERLTKSHLSRIENGLAEPSVRKLFALSQIYGMPLTSLAERFELDLQREQLSVDVKGKSGEEIYSIAIGLRDAGRYVEELVTLIAALEEFGEQPADDQGPAWGQRFRVGVCDCLIHLGRYETAKVHAEELLSEPSLPADLRVDTLVCFVICCKKLGRLTVAIMG